MEKGVPGLYGLWSLERESWQPDPATDDEVPLQFESVMDAIRAAAGYHFSFRLVPVRFNQRGEPNSLDLQAIEDQT